MRQTLDDFVKTNKSSSPKRQSLDEFVGQVESKKYTENQNKFGAVSADPSKTPVMQSVDEFMKQNIPPQELQSPAHNNVPKSAKPLTMQEKYKDDPSRKIPVIGTILRGLDSLDSAPYDIVNKIGEVGREFYTPGAGVANVAGLTGAAEGAAAKLLPKLVSNGAGRLAQKAATEAVVGAPLGVGQALATGQDGKEALKQGLYGAGLGALTPAVGKLVQHIASRGKTVAPEVEQATQRTLSTYNKPLTNPQPLDHVMSDISQEVSNRITPPLENPKLLDKYLQTHLSDIPKSEIDSLTYAEKADLAKHVQDNLSHHDIAVQVAKEKGHDWEVLTGQSSANKPRSTKYVVGDTAIPTTADGADLSAPKKVIDVQTKDGVNYYRFDGENTYMPEHMVRKTDDVPIQRQTIDEFVSRPKTTTVLPDQKIKGQALKDLKTGDELKFAQTVKNSENTPPDLLKAMEEKPMIGARTTDILDRQEAHKMIKTHGTEGLYSKLMSKTKQFSSSETVAAEMLSKHYGSLGGEDNISKAIDLVYKTSKGGREMGQAISALRQWNQLDASGVLMLGTRQLNKGVKNINEFKALTPEQGAPLTEAAQRIGTAAETKSLADEVLSIVTNKAQGEALTEAEKATVKQFQDQVKLINEKGKGILSKPKVDKVNETIKEVSQIEPKARTRDQVVSFLDAKAAKARQRLAASRHIGFAAVNKGNPVIDYAIIGASHIANGIVKLSDFTEAMVRDFGESVKPHINEAFNKATNIFRKENGLPTIEQLDKVVNAAVKNERFTAEEAKQFKAWASEIGHMSDEFKKEATQDLQMLMKELGDSTLGEKIATVETGAMLLNPVTFERNLLGNASQFLIDKMSKLATVPFDLALSKLTTGERTIVMRSMNQEKFWQNFMIGTKSHWKGVSPNGMLESYDIHPNIFKKNNPFKYLTKSLGASLGGFDHAFYMANKGDVLATYAEQLGKAQGLTRLEIKKGMKDLILRLDDRIHELADEAGKYATYQDETMLAKGAEMLKRGFNYPTDLASKKLVDAGLNKKYSMEGYGLGTLVVKFAKTPANLVMRGLDFSPVGFIRAAYELAPLVLNKSKFSQHEASRALGRALTGSIGLTGMGFILADAGILSGSYSLDKDKRSIEEQSGQGSYKVNWSALGRFITSGFDYKEAKTQEGDRMMDYAWIQPMAISLAMGVNANKAVKEMKIGEATNGWKAAGSALMGSLATVLENPMVQGLSNVVDASTDLIKNKKIDKFTNIVKGVPARFIPTLVSQARTSTDNNQRETFDNDLLTEIGNLMKNKVPGLAEKLPVSYDSLGNAREKIQGGKANTVGQYLTSFFSPARMTKYQVSDEAKLVLDLMNQSGDQNVLPRIANKYFKVKQGKNEKDLKVNLDAKQFSQLQKNLGELVKEKLAQKSTYLSNPNISLEHKVDAVKKILTEVGAKARENLGTQMGFKKKDIKG